MTKEEAIIKINRLRNEYNDQYVDYCGVNEAVNMAIKALQPELEVPEKCLNNTDVEVTRCENCEYADEYHHCDKVTFYNCADDYCSKGKPKE